MIFQLRGNAKITLCRKMELQMEKLKSVLKTWQITNEGEDMGNNAKVIHIA